MPCSLAWRATSTSKTTPSLVLNAGILNQNTNVVVNTLNQANGTWQLNVPVALNNYNLTNGELRGANCTITNLNWAGGSLNSDALGNVTTVPIGGTLTISSATAKTLSYYVTPGRTLNNFGTGTWSGAGITGQGGATINNGGTMTLNGDFGFAWGGAGNAAVLNNTGTFTKASGSGAFTMTQIYFNNSITANINSGSFVLNSCAGTNLGGIYLAPSAFLDFNSGTSYELGGFLSWHDKAVGKTLGDPHLFFIFCAEDVAHPLAEGGRAFADVHGHVKYLACHNAHQFPLGLLDLVVQATQYVFGGARVVVLYEIYFSTDGSFKLSLIEALEEEASVVTEDFGFEQDDIGDGEGGGFHIKVQGAGIIWFLIGRCGSRDGAYARFLLLPEFSDGLFRGRCSQFPFLCRPAFGVRLLTLLHS